MLGGSESIVSAAVTGLTVLLVYIAVMWAALVYWTFRDIRRRTRDGVLQVAAVAVTLLFFIPGYWPYLVLRPRLTLAELAEERLRASLLAEYAFAGSCPKCHQKTREEFLACPYCQERLRSACTNCAHALREDWKACPYCGNQSLEDSHDGEVQRDMLPGMKANKPVHA